VADNQGCHLDGISSVSLNHLRSDHEFHGAVMRVIAQKRRHDNDRARYLFEFQICADGALNILQTLPAKDET
jgi:hypothetical protein